MVKMSAPSLIFGQDVTCDETENFSAAAGRDALEAIWYPMSKELLDI